MESPHYIYIYGDNIGAAAGRDEIEDLIDERTQGFAEVTGGGAGESGWNIDIDIIDNNRRGFILAEIAKVLYHFGLPWSTILNIDGERWDFRAIYRETVLNQK